VHLHVYLVSIINASADLHICITVHPQPQMSIYMAGLVYRHFLYIVGSAHFGLYLLRSVVQKWLWYTYPFWSFTMPTSVQDRYSLRY